MSRTGLTPELSVALLESLFSQSPVGLGTWDRDLRYVWLNEALSQINGVPVDEHIGRTIEDVLPDLDPEVAESIGAVMQTGRPVVDAEMSGETPAAPGERRTWRASYFPVQTPEGETVGVGGVVTEITEERRALAAQERLQSELARANAMLRQVIERVPVGISLHWGPDHRFQLVNELYYDFMPARGEVLGRSIAEVFPDQAGVVEQLHDRVLLTGEPVEVEDYPVPFPDDPRAFEGHRYYTATVIRVEGASTDDSGVVAVFRETTDEIGRRAELETELEEEHRIALTLQQSLRPRRLPQISGVELASRFLPAGRRHEVGGDFYDVFEAPDGAWMLVLGDVCGKGPEAAALTSLARHTLRTAGMFTGEPPAVLALLNESMLRADIGMRFCTAVCARLQIGPDATSLEVACAGHCLPLLVRPDGAVREVGSQGMLLGVGPTPPHEVERVELEPGDTIIMFTDGVTDAGAPERFLEGEELHSVLAAAAGLPTAEMLSRLEAAAVPPEVGEPRDDIAMLAVRRPLDRL